MKWIQSTVVCICLIVLGGTGAKVAKHKNATNHPPFSPRLVGSTDAADGHFPYHCALRMMFRTFCGCAIISSEFAITAAHCLTGLNSDNVRILVGTNRQSEGGLIYSVKEIISHESFMKPLNAYDVALLRVHVPFKFTNRVQPIQLSAEFVPRNTDLLVTGWGRLWEDGDHPDSLQELRVRSISNDRCQLKSGYNIHASQLCTLNPESTGICSGDSGGPLVSNDGKLVGIVNWSDPPCGLGMPEGYARISFLYDWIKTKMDS